MNRLTITTWMVSALLHSAAVLPLAWATGILTPVPEVYNEGEGQVERGLTVDVVSIGNAAQDDVRDAVREQVANPTPIVVAQTKPDEPDVKNVIAATQSATEVAATTIEETAPVMVAAQEVAAVDQAAEDEVRQHRNSGALKGGAKLLVLNGYASKIQGVLRDVKPSHRISIAGRVIVGFTVDPEGRVTSRTVLQSSGVDMLDKAAIEMVDKASFPPPPPLDAPISGSVTVSISSCEAVAVALSKGSVASPQLLAQKPWLWSGSIP